MKYALLTILALLPSSAVASLDQTVGWTGGCTCVVIHPDGWALSAEHCEHNGSLTVEIDGREVAGRVVYDPPGYWKPEDRACMLKLEGGPFKWARVASEPMKVGDKFYSWGFPNGNQSFITGAIVPARDSTGAPVLAANGAAIGGHSGGPLFNERAEVAGLLSRSDRAGISVWIPLTSIQSTMQHAQAGRQQPERLVWVLTSTGCLPCENLKADYARGQFPGIEMRFIDMNTTGGRELRERIRKATGELPAFTPTLWAEGATRFTTGYSGVGTIRSWLVTAFSLPIGFWETVTGDRVGPDQKLDSQPETEPFPSPAPEIKPAPQDDGLVPIPADPPEEDVFHGVTLLLFAPRTGANDLAAKAVLALADHAGGQLAEYTEGKAQFVLVSERQTPTRYAATCTASGVPPGAWQFIAMVPAQSAGLHQKIRSKLLSFIRDSLPDAVRNAPLGLITETGSPNAYPATLEALDTPEPDAEPLEPREGGDPTSGDVPWPVAIGTAIVGLIRRMLEGKS